MLLAILLVLLSGMCLGGVAGALALGWRARIGALGRWWRHGRGGRPLHVLADAPEGTVEIEGLLRAEQAAGVVLATAVPPSTARASAGAAPRPREGADGPSRREPLPEPLNAAAGEVWIQTADGQALLAAEAFLLCGSLEIPPGQPASSLPADLGDLPADLVSIGKWPVRCLLSGDRVRATGRLERAPDLEGPGGYRTRSVRYRLRAPSAAAGPGATGDFAPAAASGGHGSATPCILLTSARPPRLLVTRRARGVAAGLGAAAALAISLLGLALIPLSGESPGPGPLPGEAVERAFIEHRYEDAAHLAADRGDAASAARGHFLSGDLPRAAVAFAAARRQDPERASSWDEIDSHIVLHDWARAAAAADRLAAALPSARDGLSCVADVLRMKADPAVPRRETLRSAGTAPWLCDLAFADLVDSERTRIRLETLVSTRHFGFLRPGPPPRPRGSDADARVAAHLLAQRGKIDDYPFSPPYGAHVLLCEGPMFRMPVPALTSWIGGKSPPVNTDIALEDMLVQAAWLSFLGDDEQAAIAYGKALRLAGLDEAVPEVQPAKGRYFNAPRIHSLLGRKSARETPGAAETLTIGTALALRAGETDAANTYVDVVHPDDDRTEVRRFVWAATDSDVDPLTHLQDHLEPVKWAFLVAGVKDNVAQLVVLEKYDGQGLWPIVGHRLEGTAGLMRGWAAGDQPSRCDRPSRPEGCGFYGLLGHWAARRGAARAMMTWKERRSAADRIGRMLPVLADRTTAVLLYVTGRLASPEGDD